ncbi:OLC1v1014590C1 [Oldenlandia corymbosa var. corymbosa]|uniref:OLC1v1014590C1 n=1 Tax=Oldenlandia corymbosa var. corymbosa TaxID=529605 RepID=A0AAV1E1D4_OLDCO|nr:OLC1v1014590C1 [Oldenlandia corymbosa var. corymbosa]
MESEVQRQDDENDKMLKLVQQQKVNDIKRKKQTWLYCPIGTRRRQQEIQELEAKVKAMEHVGDDASVHKQFLDMYVQLKEKIEDILSTEEVCAILVARDRKTSDELQNARRELILSFCKMGERNRGRIGIKRMGELDPEIFEEQCKLKFPDDYEVAPPGGR